MQSEKSNQIKVQVISWKIGFFQIFFLLTHIIYFKSWKKMLHEKNNNKNILNINTHFYKVFLFLTQSLNQNSLHSLPFLSTNFCDPYKNHWYGWKMFLLRFLRVSFFCVCCVHILELFSFLFTFQMEWEVLLTIDSIQTQLNSIIVCATMKILLNWKCQVVQCGIWEQQKTSEEIQFVYFMAFRLPVVLN